ncbi:MAG: DUF5060 domain-containing protein, partial [Terracidiphilus sp.]
MKDRVLLRSRQISAQVILVFLVSIPVMLPAISFAAPKDVSYSIPPFQIAAYDYAEITATVISPDAQDPFEDAALTGTLETEDGNLHLNVDGFCDSADGSVFRIRFMAPRPGRFRYSVTYRQGGFQKTTTGTFQAIDANRRGVLRVDPRYPWHFIWEGTGEHYFFNGTTAFWLMGWRDERTIRYSIERLHRLQVSRIRVAVAGRTNIFYGEPVMIEPDWTVFLTPWPAEKTDDFTHPGFDYSRFNVEYWQKYERMLGFARARDVVISLVLDMNDSKIHPAAG